MTALSRAAGLGLSRSAILAMAAIAGFAIVFVVGHAQSAALHDAAHDVRHATGFPCH